MGSLKQKTETIDLLVEATPANEAQSNDRIQLALQELYETLRQRDLSTEVPIMEEHVPPKTVAEQRDLIVKKIRDMREHVIN